MIENLKELVVKLNNWNNAERFKEVLAEIRDIPAEDAQETALYILKGNAEYGLGLFEDSLNSYAGAIKIDPTDAPARSNYGSVLYALGRYIDGLNACDSALMLDATFVPAYINAAHCLIGLEQNGVAGEYLMKAIENAKNNVGFCVIVADMLTDLGMYERAKEAYFKIARFAGAPVDIHEKIAEFFKRARENGIEKATIVKDVNAWRTEFVKNPDVFKLSTPFLQ